jgi:hypothetical protein
MIQSLYQESLKYNIGGMSAMFLSIGVLGLGGLTHPIVKGIGYLLLAGGSLALIRGTDLYARSRGRNGWERGLGLCSILGLGLLLCLPDLDQSPPPGRG